MLRYFSPAVEDVDYLTTLVDAKRGHDSFSLIPIRFQENKVADVKSIVDNFRATPVLMVANSADAEAHAKTRGFI